MLVGSSQTELRRQPGLIARVVTQYDNVELYPPTYFLPTVGESTANPDAGPFLLAAHLFAGTVG